MGRYLIDSNVISNFTSASYSESAMQFLANVIDRTPNISVIPKIEVLSWHSAIIQEEVILKSFINFSNFSNIISLSDLIVNKCIQIRRNIRIKTPDAIIESTAIVNNYTLLTSDLGFNRIPNLIVVNPFDL